MSRNHYFGGCSNHSILFRMPEKDEYPFSEDLEKEELQLDLEENESELPPLNVFAINELRSCSDLVRLYTTKQLEISPYFQRGLVWKQIDQSKFIDSLIKGLPIPSMCFSLDIETENRIVIDGLQRMSTIIRFLTDDKWEISKALGIDERIGGKTVEEIKKENEKLYIRVENLSLPVTIIRCNTTNKKHMEYLFTIFHRLNSGGVKLNNQEIRNCIFSGQFNELLRELTKYDNFKKLFDIKPNINYRFTFEELILRFFSFSEQLTTYEGKLASFLNGYMQEKTKGAKIITDGELINKRRLFEQTIDIVFEKVFNSIAVEKKV